jgi:hypothetical protein
MTINRYFSFMVMKIFLYGALFDDHESRSRSWSSIYGHLVKNDHDRDREHDIYGHHIHSIKKNLNSFFIFYI